MNQITFTDVAVAAVNLMSGFICAINQRAEKTGNHYEIYVHWGDGGESLHETLAGYATMLAKLEKFSYSLPYDFKYCGVYAYDVSEVFGGWLHDYYIQHDKFPDLDVSNLKLVELHTDLFTLESEPTELKEILRGELLMFLGMGPVSPETLLLKEQYLRNHRSGVRHALYV